MLKYAGTSNKLLVKAMVMAVYTNNRLPTCTMTKLTLYEGWTPRMLSTSHLHVFSCLTHSWKQANQRKKLDDYV
jgi:hypothetical protein